MANHPKLIIVQGTFLDTVEKLLNTPPPPKGAADKAAYANAKRIIKKVRNTEVVDYRPKKAGTRRKGRASKG